GLFGCVHVSSTAGAVINNNQSVNLNATLNPQAQSYNSGAVKTTYNNSTFALVGTGTNSSYRTSGYSTSEQGSGSHSSTSSESSS
ncbi:hypothetical protein SB861_64790, partial [Paraburkholderia sp. SIMBA_049]